MTRYNRYISSMPKCSYLAHLYRFYSKILWQQADSRPGDFCFWNSELLMSFVFYFPQNFVFARFIINTASFCSTIFCYFKFLYISQDRLALMVIQEDWYHTAIQYIFIAWFPILVVFMRLQQKHYCLRLRCIFRNLSFSLFIFPTANLWQWPIPYIHSYFQWC